MNANLARDLRLIAAINLRDDALCRLVAARDEDARLMAMLGPFMRREPLAAIGRAERDVAVIEASIAELLRLCAPATPRGALLGPQDP